MAKIMVNELSIDVIRKKIKNVHLAIYPPTGRIRVSAPLRLDEAAVRLFILSKFIWIKKQLLKLSFQKKPVILDYISGEYHYYQGKVYILNVIVENKKNKNPVLFCNNIDNNSINLYVQQGSDRHTRQLMMDKWYRQQLKKTIPALIEKWQNIIGVSIADWQIKKMKTRWGTCNINVRRIWLNLELAKKSLLCLEYIIVHEMVHLLERRHNARFRFFMDKFMPQWRDYKEELKRVC